MRSVCAVLGFLAAAVAACAGAPQERGGPEAVPVGEALEATARVTVQRGPAGEPVLHLHVLLRNPSAAPVRLTVLAHCPVVLRLQGAGAAEPAFDERGRPCPRVGREIHLPPAGAETLERHVPPAELRNARVPPGRYHAVVTVTAGGRPFDVPAGEVVLP